MWYSPWIVLAKRKRVPNEWDETKMWATKKHRHQHHEIIKHQKNIIAITANSDNFIITFIIFCMSGSACARTSVCMHIMVWTNFNRISIFRGNKYHNEMKSLQTRRKEAKVNANRLTASAICTGCHIVNGTGKWQSKGTSSIFLPPFWEKIQGFSRTGCVAEFHLRFSSLVTRLKLWIVKQSSVDALYKTD